MSYGDEATAGLPRIYWLGGGSGAGKTTIAQLIADQNGYELYSTDSAMGDHSSRCSAIDCPQLEIFKGMTMDERWADRTPQVMLDTFHWFQGEGFKFIIDDLKNIPSEKTVIVEGFRLLPSLVKPHLRSKKSGLWMIPTPEFRSQAFSQRGTTWDIPNKTSCPERSLTNLLARDAMFTKRLQKEAQGVDCQTVVVDGSMSEEDLFLKVSELLGLQP